DFAGGRIGWGARDRNRFEQPDGASIRLSLVALGIIVLVAPGVTAPHGSPERQQDRGSGNHQSRSKRLTSRMFPEFHGVLLTTPKIIRSLLPMTTNGASANA